MCTVHCAACTFEHEGLSVFDQMFDRTIVYQFNFKTFAVSFDIENHTSNKWDILLEKYGFFKYNILSTDGVKTWPKIPTLADSSYRLVWSLEIDKAYALVFLPLFTH